MIYNFFSNKLQGSLIFMYKDLNQKALMRAGGKNNFQPSLKLIIFLLV
jgi:hypothetical protein